MQRSQIWKGAVLLLVCASLAWAGPKKEKPLGCEATCKRDIQMCVDMCKKSAGEKAAFCPKGCQKAEAMCLEGCKTK
jgi:hypothetical protein